MLSSSGWLLGLCSCNVAVGVDCCDIESSLDIDMKAIVSGIEKDFPLRVCFVIESVARVGAVRVRAGVSVWVTFLFFGGLPFLWTSQRSAVRFVTFSFAKLRVRPRLAHQVFLNLVVVRVACPLL